MQSQRQVTPVGTLNEGFGGSYKPLRRALLLECQLNSLIGASQRMVLVSRGHHFRTQRCTTEQRRQITNGLQRCPRAQDLVETQEQLRGRRRVRHGGVNDIRRDTKGARRELKHVGDVRIESGAGADCPRSGDKPGLRVMRESVLVGD